MQNFQYIKNKIRSKKIKIGIIGIGYVGIKLLIAYSKKNIKVFCFDKDNEKLKKLEKSKSPFSYISDNQIKKINKNINYSNNKENIGICDIIILCLPTPLKKNKPDLSHLKSGLKIIKPHLRRGHLIILESTTYPGCTEEIFANNISKKFNLDKDIFLGYSPERENPGDKKFDFTNTPKIVSGYGRNSLILTDKVYKLIVKKTIKAKDIKSAEAAKLLENIYRSVNIALINELDIASHKLNININEVIDLAGTKPFGFQKFYPGPGTGGHCIPIDPIYFSWLAKRKGAQVKFIELSAKTNEQRVKWIINKIKKLISNNSLKIKNVLLLGLSYKKNIEDTRESASLKIFKELYQNKKIKVDYYDPYVHFYKFKQIISKPLIKSINYKKNSFMKYQMLIIATDHDKFNYNKILNSNKIIVDLRGRFKNINKKNLFKL